MVDTVTPSRPGRSLGRPIKLYASLIALVSVVAGVLVFAIGRRDGSGAAGAPKAPSVPDRVAARFAHRYPLLAGAHIDCNGALVPIESMGVVGTAERGTSAWAEELRKTIAHNPWQESGAGRLRSAGWSLVAANHSRVVLVDPRGTALSLTRSGNGTWQPSSLGGCGELTLASGAQVAVIAEVIGTGRRITARWDNESCGAGPIHVLDHVTVVESSTAVHLLVATTRSKDASKDGFCAGVGLSSSTQVELRRPLGDRRVFSESSVPPTRVEHVSR